MNLIFRTATEKDIDLIYRFIYELAEYELMTDQVVASKEILRKTLFGEKRYAEVILAEADGVEAGFALFFHNYSTFLGKPGIYLEDLYVRPDYRSKGIGKKLLTHIAQLAKERDCGRIEWWVLNWNPARKFYESIGAKSMDEWMVYRLSGDELDNLATAENNT